MTPERVLFDHAVSAFNSLLLQSFWTELADLFSCSFAENVIFIYGPNKVNVSIDSPFFLGHYVNDAAQLVLSHRDIDGQPHPPIVEIDECEKSTRFVLSALYGVSGKPVSNDPHRLLTNLLCEVEGRVELLSVAARNMGHLKLLQRVNDFEREYFPRLNELIASYNSERLLMPKKPLPLFFLKLRVSWWG